MWAGPMRVNGYGYVSSAALVMKDATLARPIMFQGRIVCTSVMSDRI